jgi:hypothetical protein
MVAAAALAAAAACAPPDDPVIGAPGGIIGRRPPGAFVAGAGDGDGDGGGTTGSTPSGACEPANFVGDANCAVKWSTDIFPKVKAGGTWNCAAAGCHQPNAAQAYSEPLIGATADQAFEDLRKYKSARMPNLYINPCSKDLGASSIHANIAHTLNPAMPPGVKGTDADLAKLKTWVECGAPKN